MAKITVPSTSSGYNLSVINTALQNLATELNTKVLYRANPTGEPNSMGNTLDMNGYQILNLPAPATANSPARLQDVQAAIVGILPASLVPFTPSATISAVTVQSALEEADTENRAISELLRTDLASTMAIKGAALIGYKLAVTGGKERTQYEKNQDFVTLDDFEGATDTLQLAAAVAGAVALGRELIITRNLTITSVIELPDADFRVSGITRGIVLTAPASSYVFKRVHRGRKFEAFNLKTIGGGGLFRYEITNPISAGNFIVNGKYTIVSVGTSLFNTFGIDPTTGAACSNTPGTVFIATGVGSGNGTASEVLPFVEQLREVNIQFCDFYCDVGIYAVSLFGARGITFSNNEVTSCNGLYAEFCINTDFDNNTLKNCGYGVRYAVGSEGLKINGGEALGCGVVCRGDNTNGLQIRGVMWDYNNACLTLYGGYEVSVIGCYMTTRSSTPAIFITDYSGTRGQHITITANATIRTHYSGGAAVAIRIENADFVTIANNAAIIGFTTNGIEYANCNVVKIAYNNINHRPGSITAGSFVVGVGYTITSVGSTNWVAIGAASNTLGVSFIATGVGSGDGTAGYGRFAISATSNDQDTVKIHHNTVLRPINVSVTTDIIGNSGFVTENSGFATWGTGATTFSFPHGLAMTPVPHRVHVQQVSVIESAVRWWLFSTDATNITLQMSSAPTVAASFAWKAAIAL